MLLSRSSRVPVSFRLAATAAFVQLLAFGWVGAFASPPPSAPLAAHQQAAPAGSHGEIPTTNPAQKGGDIRGKVTETMNGGGYTYVQVDQAGEGSGVIWAAGPRTSVAVGDTVVLAAGMPMQNFFSKTLDRTFDVVYFVQGIQVVGSGSPSSEGPAGDGAVSNPAEGHAGKSDMAQAHGKAQATDSPPMDFGNLPKAAGGQTVEELLTSPASFAGKEVAVRGKVTKFNANIMGKNWIHISDGTGSATGPEGRTDDLTVTSLAKVEVGQTVLIKGTAAAGKDFGAGYKYALIVEEAEITVE